jgi:hypothetical protein
MPDTVAPRSTTWSPTWLSAWLPAWPLLLIGALVMLALVGTILLWAHYGTTVFFETIRAGFAACFG